MELRQLEYAVAVADHGGFTKAAMAMHVAQPSLSHGVKALEAELGLELFARLGRSVQTTSAGELVIDAARRVLRDMAELTAISAAVKGVHIGRLELVVLPTLAVDPVAGLIGQFRRQHPGTTVRVREPEDAATIERQVASGRAELGFTDLTVGGEGLERVELFRQEVLAVFPPGTDIVDGPITTSELNQLPLIVTPQGTSTRRLLDRAFTRNRSEPNVAVEINHREAIVPLVLAGAGATLLPAPLALDAAEQGAIVRSLKPALSRRIGVLHRRGQLSPAAAAMLELAQSWAVANEARNPYRSKR